VLKVAFSALTSNHVHVQILGLAAQLLCTPVEHGVGKLVRQVVRLADLCEWQVEAGGGLLSAVELWAEAHLVHRSDGEGECAHAEAHDGIVAGSQ
jgi:hypothetical protein